MRLYNLFFSKSFPEWFIWEDAWLVWLWGPNLISNPNFIKKILKFTPKFPNLHYEILVHLRSCVTVTCGAFLIWVSFIENLMIYSTSLITPAFFLLCSKIHRLGNPFLTFTTELVIFGIWHPYTSSKFDFSLSIKTEFWLFHYIFITYS